MPRNSGIAALKGAERVYHALFTGLVLKVGFERGGEAQGEFVRLAFHRQHDERFAAGVQTLGLAALAPAVTAGRFVYLANRLGGVSIEYAETGDGRVWVRYPPPRWAYPGAAICAVGDDATIGFMRGFHARCGESLGRPELAFTCTGMTTRGDPGLEGFFESAASPLPQGERLRFDFDLRGPDYGRFEAPSLPHMDANRRARHRRNYAVAYIRNMLPALAALLGETEATRIASHTARLVGLQVGCEALGPPGPSDVGAVAAELADFLHASGDVVRDVCFDDGMLAGVEPRIGDAGWVHTVWLALLDGMVSARAPGLAVRTIVPDMIRVTARD